MTAKPAFEKLKDSVAALPAPSPALTKFVEDMASHEHPSRTADRTTGSHFRTA
jgi:hypothetical protein